MELAIIAAISENNVIGIHERDKDSIPWRIKEDMDHFVDLTTPHPVVMGRVTYKSIQKDFRPLKNRPNIIITSRDSSGFEEGVIVVGSLEEALDVASQMDDIAYSAGGRRVYAESLPLADRFELTRVYQNYDGNVFFPEVDWDEWRLVSLDTRENRISHLKYSFETYLRK